MQWQVLFGNKPMIQFELIRSFHLIRTVIVKGNKWRKEGVDFFGYVHLKNWSLLAGFFNSFSPTHCAIFELMLIGKTRENVDDALLPLSNGLFFWRSVYVGMAAKETLPPYTIYFQFFCNETSWFLLSQRFRNSLCHMTVWWCTKKTEAVWYRRQIHHQKHPWWKWRPRLSCQQIFPSLVFCDNCQVWPLWKMSATYIHLAYDDHQRFILVVEKKN